MKLFIPALTLGVAVTSCSKEESQQQAQPFKKSGDYSQYETFPTPENYGEVLEGFIDDSDQDLSQDSYGKAQAIWTLEGAINHYYRHNILNHKVLKGLNLSVLLHIL
ncbi:MAG: hypothetical protein U5L96_18765 [Owenweeksia sp.]|nr:hypothetical protein [Owenweeksia sp.]